MIEEIDQLVTAYGWLLQWTIAAAWAALSILSFRMGRLSTGKTRHFWMMVAIINGLSALEMAWPHRFEFTDLCRKLVLAIGGPEAIHNRRIMQAILIVAIMIPLCVWLARKIVMSRGLTVTARFALLGIGAGLIGFALETISYHYFDAHWVIYWTFQFLGTGLEAVGFFRIKRAENRVI